MEYSQHLPQKTRIQMYTAHHSQAILNHGLWGVIRIPKVVQGVRIIVTRAYGDFPDFHTPSKNPIVNAMFADPLLGSGFWYNLASFEPYRIHYQLSNVLQTRIKVIELSIVE